MDNTKNLFDFATKELSQDAFLRWFFENYENPELGPIVVGFINYFSKGQFESREPFHLVYGDIKGLKTYAQRDHIDVSIDFKSDKFFGQRTLVIEDKTGSEEHNQLDTYNDAIAKWDCDNSLPPNHCVYKIFYKTNEIEGDEWRRIEKAKWTGFDIHKIYDFFEPYLGQTDFDILNDYIRHILKIHESYLGVSPETADKWDHLNWGTFFKVFTEKYSQLINPWFSAYHGLYYSMHFPFSVTGNKCLNSVVLEVQIRSRLKAYLHPQLGPKTKEKWSLNDFKNQDAYEVCKKELDDLRSFVGDYGSSIIKRANTARAFGKISEKIELQNVDANELAAELDKWVSELKNLIHAYNSRIDRKYFKEIEK